jgi:hypothetical protein
MTTMSTTSDRPAPAAPENDATLADRVDATVDKAQAKDALQK